MPGFLSHVSDPGGSTLKTAMMKTILAAIVFVSTGAAAADGKALFEQKGCIACHGPEGNQPTGPTYPKLKGQNKDYMIQQIKDIKSGARSNGLTAMMKPIVKNLNDEEIAAVAEYLSTL